MVAGRLDGDSGLGAACGYVATHRRRRAATRDRRLVRRFHPLGVHAFLLAVLIVEIDIAVKVWSAALTVLGH